MKRKTTKKAVMKKYSNIISINYAHAQYLLSDCEPIAYTSGLYGWYADVYQIDDSTAIVTGYEPFGNIHPFCETVREFETAAGQICRECHDSNIRHRRLAEARRDFLGTVLNK